MKFIRHRWAQEIKAELARAKMLVFWKHKLILFAVPKTGTTALEHVLAPSADIAILNPPGLKHCNVMKYERDLAKFVDREGRGFERVAVIREPIDWLGSWYRYRRRPEIAGRPKAVPLDVSFDRFVCQSVKDKPPPYAHLGSQGRFLSNKAGALGVDRLYRYEAHSALIAYLEARLERPIETEKRNVSPPVVGDMLGLSENTRRLVEEHYARDYTYWTDALTG